MADLALPIENGAYGVEAGSILAALGLSEIQNYIEDDWDDNSLTSRTSPEDGVFAHPDGNVGGDVLIGRYRPEWVDEDGGVTATNQQVEFSTGSNYPLTLASSFSTGSITLDTRQTGTSSSGSYNFIVLNQTLSYCRDHSGDGYEFLEQDTDANVLYFYRVDGGATNTISSTSITADTNWHTHELTRDSYGNFEGFRDGTSQFTTLDDTHANFNSFSIVNRSLSSSPVADNLVVN